MKKKILYILLILFVASGFYAIGYHQSNTVNKPVAEVETIKEETKEEGIHYLSMYDHLLSLKEPVYVIGHKSPDTDTVVSSITTANLLRKIGVDAKAVVAGELNNETKEILEYIGYEKPDVLEDASGLNLFLVDHNAYSQIVDGGDKANIVGIIDHHNVDDIPSTDIIYASYAPLGSTSMIVYTKYKELGIEVDEKIAGLLCAGLISDTNNLKYSVSDLDKQLFFELLPISKIDRDDFNLKRLSAKVDYEGKTDKELLLLDYKDYDIADKKVGIGNLNSIGDDDSRQLISRMTKTMEECYKECGVDYLYMMIHDYITDKQYILCVGENAKETCEKALNTSFGDYLTLESSISRKKDFVPALTRTIQENQELANNK